MTEPIILEDNNYTFLEKESSVTSQKYPGLTVKHEVLLDWIIDFAMFHGRMPTNQECFVGYAHPGFNVAIDGGSQYIMSLLRVLFEANYLVPEGGVVRRRKHRGGAGMYADTIAGIGDRIREPLIKVLFGRVLLGPSPHRGLFPDECMELAWRLDRAARLAERS